MAADAQPEPEAEPGKPARQDEQTRRLSRIYIATTLAAGLLIAAGYVGSRIFASNSHHAGPAPTARLTPAPTLSPSPAAVAPPAEPKPQASDPAAQLSPAPTAAPLPEVPASVSKAAEPAPADHEAPSKPGTGAIADTPATPALATPLHGETYLQVAALGPSTTSRFINELRGSKFEPLVAPGPWEGIDRILIGPFSDRQTLESVKAQLETMGITPFVRTY